MTRPERQGPRALLSRAGPRPRGSRLPPEPAASGWLGMLPAFRTDPLRTLRLAARECGDVVQLRFGPPQLCVTGVLLTHPSGVARVLRTHQQRYPKSFTSLPARAIFGTGLLTSDGSDWEWQRRLVRPLFHRQQIAPLLDSTVAGCARLCERLRGAARRGEPVDIGSQMARLSLEVLGNSVFGTDFTQADVEVIWRCFPVVSQGSWRRTVSPWAWLIPGYGRGLPLPANRRFVAALEAIEGIVDRLIAQRRQGGGGQDLLSLLLEVRDEHGRPLDRRVLRDEIMTFLVAGHETTAVAMAWTLYELARNPGARDPVESEAASAPAGDGSDVDPDRLVHARAAVEEALRLYPPAWSIVRDAATDDEVSGLVIPRRSIVITCPFVTQRDERFWPRPDAFLPERFLDVPADRPTYAYFPFGAGSRRCIGERFALTQASVVVARLLRAFRFEPAGGEAIRAVPAVTLRPQRPILLHVRERP